MRQVQSSNGLHTWLSTRETAARLGGVSPDQVYSWVEAGELQAMDISRSGAKRKTYAFKPEWVEAFMEKRTLNGEGSK